MLKQQAIDLLGGTISAASDAIGVSYQAVKKWPDPLPPRIADRVQAALWRMQHGVTPLSPSEKRATSGAVTRSSLRPHDCEQIWPDLTAAENPQPKKDAA